ncbi:unnamed protein product [Anisakis simplex]|uniref:SORBS2 n=1 Tax=Anisakis simplex TaxID=6269 RepID=A0A0M3JZ95_ANISI|nr:unnamed protein product [Anisakis simplex]
MSSPQGQGTSPISVPPRERTLSVDSENLSVSSSSVGSQPQRKFSLTGLLGRRTSVSEAYKRYSGFTTNGDGFQREDYRKPVDIKKHFGIDEHGNTVEKHNQDPGQHQMSLML